MSDKLNKIVSDVIRASRGVTISTGIPESSKAMNDYIRSPRIIVEEPPPQSKTGSVTGSANGGEGLQSIPQKPTSQDISDGIRDAYHNRRG